MSVSVSLSRSALCIRRGALLVGLCCATLIAGCASRQPAPLARGTLQEAQTFPYFRLYWAGPAFEGYPLTAADGRKSYDSSLGESLYYGNCDPGKGTLHTGTCTLPLQVTTVVYRAHLNAPLGAQRNLILRGVPATVFNGGQGIQLYTGHLALDVRADSPARADAAVRALRPLNAPGSAAAPLAPPTFCPGLTGPGAVAVEARTDYCQINAPGQPLP